MSNQTSKGPPQSVALNDKLMKQIILLYLP